MHQHAYPPSRQNRALRVSFLLFDAMSKIPYGKPATTYPEQLDQLAKRGLLIKDPQKAAHLLEAISYYRLSGYWYPLLQDKSNHKFKPNSDFESVFKLYCFDRELRRLVISELEKIEVAVRAKMIYVLSCKHGAFWFKDPNHFKNPVKHAGTISKIGDEYKRSDEEFINAFRNKYSDPLPPSWMTMEIMSFGTLSMLYSNLRPSREKKEVANFFGVSDKVFISWLHSIVYIRNVCAHHSRLWNRGMSITAEFPRNPKKTWLNNTSIKNNRTYFILCMIRYLLQTVNPKTTFTNKLKSLFAQYPNVDPTAMNFPKNWESEPLWK